VTAGHTRRENRGLRLQILSHMGGEFTQAVGTAAHLVIVPAEHLDMGERMQWSRKPPLSGNCRSTKPVREWVSRASMTTAAFSSISVGRHILLLTVLQKAPSLTFRGLPVDLVDDVAVKGDGAVGSALRLEGHV
jgi:hypothetical protein